MSAPRKGRIPQQDYPTLEWTGRRLAERTKRRYQKRVAFKPEPAHIAARLREIPDDTRSLTAQILGDPLPGRSALDMERQ